MSTDQLRPLQEREYQKIQFGEIKPGDQIRIELNRPSRDWPGRPFRYHGVVSPPGMGYKEDLDTIYICNKDVKVFGKPLLLPFKESDIIGIERFQ